MKILMGLVLILILAAATASTLHLADGPLAAVFPQDRLHRADLSGCEQQSPQFNRLDAAARDRCYHDGIAATAQPNLPPNTAQAPNQVDLRAAASRDVVSGSATPPPAPVTPIRR